MTESDLTALTAARIAGHVRDVQEGWPGVLGKMSRLAALRGQPDIPEWPPWCWLPMGAVAAYLASCGNYEPYDIGIVAAVGQWRLLGGRIIVPAVDAAEAAVPHRAASIDEMDLRLPRPAILDALAGGMLLPDVPAAAAAGRDPMGIRMLRPPGARHAARLGAGAEAAGRH